VVPAIASYKSECLQSVVYTNSLFLGEPDGFQISRYNSDDYTKAKGYLESLAYSSRVKSSIQW
jgi:hypothetical protein